MKSTKAILLITIIAFVSLAAVLELLVIFNVTGADETREAIVKLAQASAVIAGALVVIFGVSRLGGK